MHGPSSRSAQRQTRHFVLWYTTTRITCCLTFCLRRKTCPRSLCGGWSGIRTCNPPNARHRTYHWAISSQLFGVKILSIANSPVEPGVPFDPVNPVGPVDPVCPADQVAPTGPELPVAPEI